jgi:ATP-dependent DNA helicase RecQ
MPTGGGKSLCFQVPGLLREGVCVVISPLISLMQDQVQTLNELGLIAYAYNSSLTLKARQKVEEDLRAGVVDFLYMAPERLFASGTMDLLREVEEKASLSLFAIDEAHCVSAWGHDFRPEYRKLASLARYFPTVPRMALTATADKFTRADIIRELKLESARVYMGSFDRPNIHYSAVKRERQGTAQLMEYLEDKEGMSGIIYCLSRRKVEETTLFLQEKGYPAMAYHAGLDTKTRYANQSRFISEENQIMVATIAFGMGIDKPDVRYVVHMDLPKNIENYYQETGRAGRDGLESEALLFYGARDPVILKQMMRKSRGKTAARFHFESEALDSMHALGQSLHCRRQIILQSFDEDFRAPCGNCDNCERNELPIGSFRAREWSERILGLYHRTGAQLCPGDIVDLARGLVTAKVRQHKWFDLIDFGFCMDTPEKGVAFGLRSLMAIGLLKADWSRGGSLVMTNLAVEFLRSSEPIYFLEDPRRVGKTTSKKKVVKKTKSKSSKASAKVATKVSKKKKVRKTRAPETGLLGHLKELRRREAKRKRVPAYKVFHDQTLIEMAQQKPESLEEFLELYGVGEVKAKKYGPTFLKALGDFD